MNRTRAVLLVALLVGLCISRAAAQTAGGLSGTVTNPAGAPVVNVTVSLKNLATGQVTESRTDAAGRYSAPSLPPGDYDVSATTDGLAAKTVRVTMGAAGQTLNLALAPVAAKPGELSLGDLGFTPEQTKGSAAEQARLNRRSSMLKMHQRLGIITTAPLIATLISSNGAAGKRDTGSSSGRQLHAVLGSVTAGMYLTTASFAIFAPKAPPGTKVRGPIRLHRALAWIHGPGMILTPILGAIAYQQRNRGERVHGIAQAHAPVAVITSIAYGLAIASVSIKF